MVIFPWRIKIGPASQALWVASMPGRHSRVDLKKLHLGVNSARETRYRLS